MKERNNTVLQIRAEIDQQVAARHQLQFGERSIAQQIVGGKEADFP
jgi:hypothetical protein